MKTNLTKKKQFVGLLYGLAAGLGFGLFAWGLDAVLLTSANGAHAWVKFWPGVLISMAAGALVGWLSMVIKKTLLSMLLWLGFGLLLSWLVFWLPYKAAPDLIGLVNENLGKYLDYPFFKDFLQIQWFGFVVIALVAIICAVIQQIIIEQAFFSTGKLALAMPLILSFALFCLVGSVIDGMNNRHVREPLQAVDELIQFSLDNQGVEIAPDVARKMHLAALAPIEQYLQRDRSLVLSNYDQSFGQVDILVNFDGYWVVCQVIYNQVTFCKEAVDAPRGVVSQQLVSYVYPGSDAVYKSQ